MLTIPQNPAAGLAAVRERITVAARARSRDAADVTLIGVAKSQPLERLHPRWMPGSPISEKITSRKHARTSTRWPAGASAATSSARCRPTRRARPRSSSTGCIRLTVADRGAALRPAPRVAAAARGLPPGPARRRVDEVRRRTIGACRACGRGRGNSRGSDCAASCACPPRKSNPARQRRWFAELRRLLGGSEREAATASTRCRWA